MTGAELKDAITRLIDSAMGEVPDDEIIEILEGRIGVVQARADECENDDDEGLGDCTECGVGLTLDPQDGSHYCPSCGLVYDGEGA